MSGRRVQKVSVVEQVVAYIQEMIDSGEWAEGKKIESETQMAEKLGVSRVTVRNAVREFIALGQLESFQGKGTFVKSANSLYFPNNIFAGQTKVDVQQILQIRASIEQDAAYYAAQNSQQRDLDYLESNISLMIQADQAKNSVVSWGYDREFHLRIARMAGNPYYFTIMSWIFAQSMEEMQKVIDKIGTRYANYFHPNILRAISDKDADMARKIMREHLTTLILQLDK